MKASLGRWIIKKYPNDPVKYVNRIQEYYSDFDKESVRYWDGRTIFEDLEAALSQNGNKKGSLRAPFLVYISR